MEAKKNCQFFHHAAVFVFQMKNYWMWSGINYFNKFKYPPLTFFFICFHFLVGHTFQNQMLDLLTCTFFQKTFFSLFMFWNEQLLRYSLSPFLVSLSHVVKHHMICLPEKLCVSWQRLTNDLRHFSRDVISQLWLRYLFKKICSIAFWIFFFKQSPHSSVSPCSGIWKSLYHVCSCWSPLASMMIHPVLSLSLSHTRTSTSVL